ncbi:L-sorbose 1-dehydrogenase [Leucoagaricus sp. SymC.cos]|nr:L-sorbose 1-dehydrogenase [Leucoagaricus sp. SymC.cos]
MVGRRLTRQLSSLVLFAVSLVSLRQARSIPLGLRNKFLWISTLTMAFMLRQILVSPSPRLVTNHAKVGKKAGEKKEVDFDEYDFVIVGGGNTGCVLAARLSEDPFVRVLVLEAGGSGKSLMLTRIPVAFPLLFHTKYVYQLYTEPQGNAKGQKKFWPRAKMLGGCSSINAEMAQYGAPQDFDEWGKVIDDEAWSWKNMSRYFNKFERYEDDSRYPDVNSKAKGKGPVQVGYFGDLRDPCRDFVQACTKIGVPFSPDFNTTAGTRGVNRVMTYIDENRTRVSSETAYLTKEVLARPNLTVVVNATVTKILTEKNGDEIRAVGVEFAKTRKGQRYTVRAKKEVIVAAGAIHSPQILMLSGIGPAEQLKSKKIPVILDLPGVGSNLVDHPVVDLYFKDKHNNSTKHVKPQNLPDAIKFLGALYQYLMHKSGPLTGNVGEAAAFIRSDDPALFPGNDFKNEVKDSTSGDNSPDLEIFISPVAYKEHAKVVSPMHTLSIHCCLVRPMSKGALTLKTNDPFDLPAVDPKYLSAPEDVEKIRRGLRFIFKVAKQEPLASHVDFTCKHKLLDTDREKATDRELEEIIRGRVETLYHPAGTCRMAPEADNGVVDSQLRVYGIKGLRVADASIFPEIVSGHTAGACYAIGEHASDILKTEYDLKTESG